MVLGRRRYDGLLHQDLIVELKDLKYLRLMLQLDPLDAIPRGVLLLLMLSFIADLDILGLKLDCPVLSDFRVLFEMQYTTLSMM